MIVSRTPFRISFFGGGTDYPVWFEKNKGAVISTTIDKYLYLSVRYLPPFFTHNHRIVWSKVELVNEVNKIQHPLIREGLKMMGYRDDNIGFDIHYQSDLPARSGMGSSSAFAVGLLRALLEISKKKLSKKAIAYQAIKLERDILGEYVGSQDQVAASFGGFNRIDFKENHKVEVRKIKVEKNRIFKLENKLMLFYTGLSRFASEIAESIVKKTNQNISLLKKMQSMVDDAQKIILSTKLNIDDFGILLDESWKLKRKLSNNISNPKIDKIYNIAIKNGALGGKILGAGGAGFMLFYVDQKHQIKIREALRNLLYVPFKFSNSGTRIIYNDNKDKFIKIS